MGAVPVLPAMPSSLSQAPSRPWSPGWLEDGPERVPLCVVTEASGPLCAAAALQGPGTKIGGGVCVGRDVTCRLLPTPFPCLLLSLAVPFLSTLNCFLPGYYLLGTWLPKVTATHEGGADWA